MVCSWKGQGTTRRVPSPPPPPPPRLLFSPLEISKLVVGIPAFKDRGEEAEQRSVDMIMIGRGGQEELAELEELKMDQSCCRADDDQMQPQLLRVPGDHGWMISDMFGMKSRFGRRRWRRRVSTSGLSLFVLLLLFSSVIQTGSAKSPLHPSRGTRKLQAVHDMRLAEESISPSPTSDEHKERTKLDFPSPNRRSSSSSGDKSRRDLSGLGSSPPQCNSKCGFCTPCRAVHVPIQPGLVRTTEYYPEAWRCKCGNKLYMP